MAIRSWRGFGRSGTSPEREVPAAVRDAGAGGAATERRGSGDRRAALPDGPRCAPALTGLRPRGLSIISVRPRTPNRLKINWICPDWWCEDERWLTGLISWVTIDRVICFQGRI